MEESALDAKGAGNHIQIISTACRRNIAARADAGANEYALRGYRASASVSTRCLALRPVPS